MKSSAITTAQFKLGTALLPLLVKGITEEHTMVRPGDIGNSINFIVGHVTATRFSLARTIGLDAQFEWAP
ncbi:MAG: hypothetical protein KKA42_15800, partial [candidate division Zixibacteria bacterium]|nr:hypothetical protein [candidate division Zixibacteria bacterium]